MATISNDTFKFLKDLSKNNNKEWFTANKKRYEMAKADFEAFVTDMVKNMAKFDPPIGNLEPKKCIFRIYRDTRFSKDKTPYKSNIGANFSVSPSKIHDHAGYYIHIEPGKSFLAGGAYEPQAPWINNIRQEIDYNTKEFKKIISAAAFKKNFGEIKGDKLKTVPKGFPKDHPELSLLQYKSFLLVHDVDDKLVTSDGFMKHLIDVYKSMKPFNDFLNRAAG
jgi:uncharacterized protein (TIGR02453 family)